jgi:capsid assembly protease
MAVKLISASEDHAKRLISAGKVDKSSSWSLSADEENALLGDNDWAAYASWHLGEDDSENTKTKARYKYPFGKGGKVYRSALIAIRQRAAQQDATSIYDAAGRLVDQIDDAGKEDDNDADDAGALRVRLEVAAAPWALLPEVLGVLAAGAVPSSRPVRRATGTRSAGIAVIPVRGVITQRGWWGTSLDEFDVALAEAAQDPGVGAILLHIDSPGGSVYGVSESADRIRAVNSKKPVVAVADSLAASAAYWLGSAASEFYITPGGEAGSIGVWQAHQDVSKLMSRMGVSTTLISAGKYKTEGHPFAPLGEDAQAFMQGRVDDYYGAFTRSVAKGRGVSVDQVRSGMGQGRVLGADAAVAAGMADGVMTLGAVMRKMMREAKRPAGSMNARRELELLG